MWLGGKSFANKADVAGCGAATVEAGSIEETFTLDAFEHYVSVKVGVAGIVGGSEIEVVALECSFHRN